MKFKLIRKLKNCPMPIGTVSGEMVIRDGYAMYCFPWVRKSKSCIPDNRENVTFAWMCACMPYYFKAVKSKQVTP
jgi:hypothetical protein